MKKYYLILFVISVGAVCCSKASGKRGVSSVVSSDTSNTNYTNKTGNTIETRFQPPSGFTRIEAAPQSFAEYLRNLPLKPAGSKVLYYDGRIKSSDVYEAVVDMEIGKRDLQQCADACMRLRGEYLYSLKAYDQISFTLVNGFKVNYSEWIKGNRVVVKGNKTYWSKTKAPSNTYKDFREYMDFIFTYASTLSLSKEMKPRDINELAIGDVFVVGGSPGHAVIVVDIAQNKNGKKVFMLAQSYMPAQETQILKNMQDPGMSPWYSADIAGKLYTPEWTFELNQLKTW